MRFQSSILLVAFLGAAPHTVLAAPDLVVKSVALSPAQAPAGTGTIELVFENIGPDDVDLPLTEFTNYTVAIDGTPCDSGFISDLNAGETNAESTSNCNPSTPGPHVVTVVIDSDGDVTESNESNNSLDTTLTWSGPDLVVQSIALEPSSPPYGTGTLTVVFANIGGADVDLGATTFLDYTVTLDGTPCAGTWLFDLGAGDTNEETITSCNPTTPGPHTITVTIDSEGEVAEENETNNVATQSFTWTGPDLVVQSITLDPASPAPNAGTGSLSATFANTGSADVDLPLDEFTNYRVLLDGVECDTGFISDLAVGDTNVESLSGACIPDVPNEHVITVIIDTDEDVAETDETNNAKTETFTWSGPDLVVTEIALDPPGAAAGSGKIVATVANQGPYGTGVLVNINVTMYLDGVACDTGLIIAGLGADATATEETTSCNPSTAGPHTIRFDIDTDADVAETDETNNSLEVTLTWTEDGECDAEQCDGLDNDCDGQTDEDFSQQLGMTCSIPDCTSDGVYACGTDGGLACVSDLTDADEVCDGEDNDCDGVVDEVWSELDTACTSGVGACETSGVFVCNDDQDGIICDATPDPPAVIETCGNDIDDDCDGATDEDCDCSPGDTQPCGVDTGACAAGVQNCVDGAFAGDCVGEISPTEEICDGEDNDCDGDLDEGCHCDDAGAQPCPEGTTCNTTTGACDPVSGGEDTGPTDVATGTPDEGTADNGNGADGAPFVVDTPPAPSEGGGGSATDGCAQGSAPRAEPWMMLALGLIFWRRRYGALRPHGR